MESKSIPCFLCGEEIEIKNSKKGKPYFICDPCGLQAFIRREKGIERLKAWMEEGDKEFKKKDGNKLLDLVKQMEEIETKKGLVPVKETKFLEAALKKEVKEIKRQVRKVLKGKG